MTQCGACGSEMEAGAAFCPECGTSPAGSAPRRANLNESRYLYRMMQVPPTITVKERDHNGSEAATYLQNLTMQLAGEGWDFYRVDTLGVVTQPGCLSMLFGARQSYIEYFVVTFRRLRR